jgi:tetratricopeptide (TPR) repeat protein
VQIFTCPSCGAKFDVSRFTPGTSLRCSKCKNVFQVPASDAAVSPVADDAPLQSYAPATDSRRAQAPAAKKTQSMKSPVTSRAATVAAEQAARPSVRKGQAAGGRDARTRPQGKPSGMMLYVAIGVGALLLVAGAALVVIQKKNSGSGDKDKTKQDNTPKPPPVLSYADELMKRDLTKAKGHIEMAKWCQENKKTDKTDEHLKKAIELDPQADGLPETIKAVYLAKTYDLKSDDANGHCDLAAWCKEFGLDEKMNDHINKALKIDKDCAKAHEMLGEVKVVDPATGKVAWEPRDLIQTIADREEELKPIRERIEAEKAWWEEEKAKLLAEGPRGKRKVDFLETYRGATGTKFSAENGFSFFDENQGIQKPYLICVQWKIDSKDPEGNKRVGRTPEEEKYAKEFNEVLQTLFNIFDREFGDKFGLKDMVEDVIPVYVFASHDKYKEYGRASGMGAAIEVAGGHYEPYTGRFFVFRGINDIFSIVFHEGTHQLVDYARRQKGGHEAAMRESMVWFGEGIANYFMAYQKDNMGGYQIGKLNQWYVDQIIAVMATKKYIPLKDFMKWTLGDMWNNTARQGQQVLGLCYMQSWAIVYFCYKSPDKKYKEMFDEYMRRELCGKGGRKATEEVFGDLQKFDDEWAKFYCRDSLSSGVYLGANLADWNEALLKKHGLDEPVGVLATAVSADTPAGKGGMQVNDIIIKFNGETVNDTLSLRQKIVACSEGQAVKVVVLRDKKEVELNIKLEKRPEEKKPGK